MSYRRIFALVGWFGLILASAMGVVWVFSALSETENFPGVAKRWMLCFVSVATASALLIILGRGKKSSTLFAREAMAVAGLGWIYCSFCAALPLLGIAGLDLPKAIFEAVSGLTTTGGTVIADVDALPPSINLWRCMMQWIGGLGVVFLFVAVLGSGGRRLIHNEASRLSADNLQPQVQKVALGYGAIYLAISVICLSGYLVLGMDFFEAICFTMTTCATGGMSPVNDFVGVFSSPLRQVWCMVMMVMCGIAFPLHYQFWLLRRWGVLKQDLELRVYLGVLLVAVAMIAVNLMLNDSFENTGEDVLASAFQVVSIMTTTGYGKVDFARWPDFSQMILVVLMMIGGCAGSTSGGLKVSRIIIFWKALMNWLKGNFSPRSVRLVSYGKSEIPEHMIIAVISYVGMYFSMSVLGIVVLALLQSDLDMVTLVSAVISAFNNIGPALGELGPMSNFSQMSWSGHIWLSLLMLMGRLEITVLVALFVPSFWKKF